MKQFFAPLGVFFFGMLLILLSTVFFPAIDTAATQLQADTANISANYWGFAWATGSTRLLIFVVGLLSVVFSAGMAWLKQRSR